MTWETSYGRPDTRAAAKELDSSMVQLIAQLREWRDVVAASSEVDSKEIAKHFQAVVALRHQLVATAQLPGVKDAIAGMFPDKPEFDPEAEFPPTVAALEAFAGWVLSAWPYKVDPGNGAGLILAFDQVNPQTFGLRPFKVELDANGKQVVLDFINGILARFGQQP